MFKLNSPIVILISLSVASLLISQIQAVNTCWDPSTGTEKACQAGVNDGFCQVFIFLILKIYRFRCIQKFQTFKNVLFKTNLSSGVGACSLLDTADPTVVYCNTGDDCNKIVTQCYDPSSSSSVQCGDPTVNAQLYCQV